MENVYYQRGEKRAESVQLLFDRIARRYDLVNDLQSFGLHRRWKARVAVLTNPRAGTSMLDVCCGTGDIARALAARGARVTALDFSQPMLDVARRRTQQSASGASGFWLAAIDYIRADAMSLPFQAASFDAVTVGYGLRNLSDWRAGLAEMVRVVKPGGRVVVLDFGKPPNAVLRSLYFAYLRLFVPALGKIVCGDSAAYAYILKSLSCFPAQEGIRAEMTALGLKNVRVELFLGGVMAINYGVA
jgi:demethylmenaquinone methyltransferase/2-methoxy-6-polyprenyl-1,4-benzoquinol methylase